MAYIALYRKYRPIDFKSILGQNNIVKILKNQVKTGKISHAYLFSGTRGTGKTSAAKVFSRAINCLDPHDGEPCNECNVCKGILEGNITDVIEMDAASNNSVENIRQIRQEVVYATVDVKYRVYIIDEVHMLTTSAFNALLKTLEEPPENVVFILATTEQHKIPVTILSRCLRFDFNRISDEYILERLKHVLELEKIKYQEDALEYIAKLADGALRDALSILDRCISEVEDILKYEDVLRIVGAVDKQVIKDIVQAILDFDSIKANQNIDLVIKKGKDLRQLAYQITEEFLALLIAEKDNDKKQRNISIIDRMSRLDNEIRQSSRPAIVLKACIVELCSIKSSNLNSGTSNIDNNQMNIINQKLSLLEGEISSLKKLINTAPKIEKNFSVQQPVQSVDNNVKKEQTRTQNVNNKMTPFKQIDEFKKIVVEGGKLKLYSALAGANIYISDEFTVVITSNSFAYSILKTEESVNTIKQVLKNNYNIDKDLRIELNEKNEDERLKIERLFAEKDVNYTKID